MLFEQKFSAYARVSVGSRRKLIDELPLLNRQWSPAHNMSDTNVNACFHSSFSEIDKFNKHIMAIN